MTSRSSRVSHEQRKTMLKFMLAHSEFARGRVTGPDAARTKKILQQELSLVLNSMGSGAKKQPEKWWKCWQDWKSDTKSKNMKINKYQAGTGGGPAPAPLTPTEATLLEFFGIEMVEGSAVPDPLEESAPPLTAESDDIDIDEDDADDIDTDKDEDDEAEQPSKYILTDDLLRESLVRQAAAMENLAAGLNRLADNVGSVAAALLAVAAAIEKH